MTIYEKAKSLVTAREAAEHYGLTVNRYGMALCPFHDDHNPSMKLDDRFHCFGCGEDGDVIPNQMFAMYLQKKQGRSNLRGRRYRSFQKPLSRRTSLA